MREHGEAFEGAGPREDRPVIGPRQNGGASGVSPMRRSQDRGASSVCVPRTAAGIIGWYLGGSSMIMGGVAIAGSLALPEEWEPVGSPYTRYGPPRGAVGGTRTETETKTRTFNCSC